MHEVTLRIVQEPSPIPSTVSTEIPAAFNPIVLKCLEKNPEKRFQTGKELAKVLAALARSLVQRHPDDSGSTRIHHPDLETRIHGTSPPPAAPTSRFAELWRGLRERIQLPEWAEWEVESRWAWIIIGATVVLLGLTVTGLRMKIDRGPFAAPSVASTRNLNAVVGSLRTAAMHLGSGDLTVARRAIQTALDQVPSSPAGRRLAREIHSAIEAERTSSENQRLVAELVTEGRRLYRAGDYVDSGNIFREALELDPLNEIAASYLELSEERVQRAQTRRTTSRSTRSTGAGTATAAAPPPTPTPASGIARVTLSFDSPISSGAVAVTLDGETLAEVPFDFSEKGVLGFKRKSSGTVRRVILTPSGTYEVGVQLFGEDRNLLGAKSFKKTLAPESRWTLRVDLPSKRSDPGFFLVQSAQ